LTALHSSLSEVPDGLRSFLMPGVLYALWLYGFFTR
jgi:hypothetical protein